MRLIQFAVKRYRSIIDTERLPLGDLTVLVGPNNEGKSNLLQALVAGMGALSGSKVRVGRRYLRPREGRGLGSYSWERDFPRSLQDSDPEGESILDFDFELTSDEVHEFEREVGSRLNGVLPLRLSFGSDPVPKFHVRKQRHAAALSARREEIARFVGGRVTLQYIPAARTAATALEVVEEMVRDELAVVESQEAYRNAMERIREIQQPVLEELAETIRVSLEPLLPGVSSVTIELEDRFRAPVSHARVIVDDGSPTELELKGDGVQSLAALSLIRHRSEQEAPGGELILAVEEPESHVHPEAIHEIAHVLRQTAESQQVVITTHSPLLINRATLGSNIIVSERRARPAPSIDLLRRTLGVRVSDNLQHAEAILVVEGPEDETALTAVLGERSELIAQALASGLFCFQPMHGGAKLSYVLSQLKNAMCRVHVLLDDDREGRRAAEQAVAEGLLAPADQTLASRLGAGESEIEDLYRVIVYRDVLQQEFNVDPTVPLRRASSGKWSARMRLTFQAQGQVWSDDVKASVKNLVSRAVAVEPDVAIEPTSEPVVAALVQAIEAKIHPPVARA